MHQPSQHQLEGLDLLRAQDLARALLISVRSVWKLSAHGGLPPPIRLGRSTRWRAADVRRWIEEQGQSRDELAAVDVGGRGHGHPSTEAAS